MYIYCADVYCDACGEAIRQELQEQDGKHTAICQFSEKPYKPCTCNFSNEIPEDPDDESSYDSDEYPKGPYDDEQESDTPQHCGSGEICLCAEKLANGVVVGKFLENNLTVDGVNYVIEHFDADSPVSQLWINHYKDFHEEIEHLASCPRCNPPQKKEEE